jgi:3-oxoadipate enol-lactonase
MTILDVVGAKLHYRLDGPVDAPVVMLGNSLGTTLDLWERQMPALTRHFRVLRYDMRGHGGSSIPDAPFDVERLALDAVAILDALGLARVRFCGISLGGMVGLSLGAQAPERLHSLVLCNSAATLGSRAGWDARIDAVVKGGMGAVAAGVLERWLSPEFRREEPGAAARLLRMLLAAPADGYVVACAAVRDADQRTLAACIRAPTLVVGGAKDHAAPPAESRWLAHRIAGARYVELAAAHLSNVEAAPHFNQRVLEFLAA